MQRSPGSSSTIAMAKPEPTRLEDRFEADGLHYLGGESRLELLRQADVLLEGGGFTLPAHRCILSKGSKVCMDGAGRAVTVPSDRKVPLDVLGRWAGLQAN